MPVERANFFPKIISANQMQLADKQTISQGISSIDLMEKAALAFVSVFIKHVESHKPVAVFCGTGNNGGDGFVIARILTEKKYRVAVFLVKVSLELSPDCALNASKIINYTVISKAEHMPQIAENSIVIDAIFGTGLTRSAEGLAAEVIKKINQAKAIVYSVDVPSGLMCDYPTPSDNIIKASVTITFQRPKYAFFLPGFGDYVNEWLCIDIGLDEHFIQHQSTCNFYIDERVKLLRKPRAKFSHKGDYGHALIVAGSFGKMGAAILAAKACLTHGVGLLTMHVPSCGYQIMQISVPEAMCTVDVLEKSISALPKTNKYSAIAAGPGLGTLKETMQAIAQLLDESSAPLVLDADALNIIAEIGWQQKIPAQSIITPHPKEFDRLFGKTTNSFERIELAKQNAQKLKIIIVLKGAHTAIVSTDGKVYFNTSGGTWLAQGGSGDKLTGVITAFLAQSYSPLEAALLGVYLHGIKEND